MKQTKVSITTKQQVRFEGKVYVVDKVNRSIFLKDVTCFGTEDRPSTIFIPSKSKVLPLIEFHNEQILEIKKITATEIDASEFPGVPFRKEMFVTDQTKPLISSLLNKSANLSITEEVTLPKVQIRVGRNERRYLSQSPQKGEISVNKRNKTLKPLYFTNNYLQQQKIQHYSNMLQKHQIK